MTKAKWKQLLSNLEIKGEVAPLSPGEIDRFESESGVKLPSSYRAYCAVFGAGQLGGHFKIAVPLGNDETYDLKRFSESQHELGDQFAELGVEAAQIERSVFFAWDSDRSVHFFDANAVTGERGNECGVFTLFEDCRVQRTAENFWEFVNECCLGEKRSGLIESTRPVERVFRPVR